MTIKNPFKTVKEFAWEIWLKPSLARSLYVLIGIVGWGFYALIFYRFLSDEHIIKTIPELIVEVIKLFQKDSTPNVSLSIMFLGLCVHVFVPIILLAVLVQIWHVMVYPTKQKMFLQHVSLFRATETKRLLRKSLIKAEVDLLKVFESARGFGAELPIDTIKKYALDYIELTNSDKFMMTTLYSPYEIYTDKALRAAVEGLTRAIINKGESLTRICIGNECEFDATKYPIEVKWFNDIHAIDSDGKGNGQKVKIVYVTKETAILNGTDKINKRADVLVLGESLAFALGTNEDTMEVPPGNKFKLFLLESAEDIKEYRRFFDNLLQNTFTMEHSLEGRKD